MNSSIGTAKSALNAATIRQANTAHSLANINTPPFRPRQLDQVESVPAGTRIAGAKQGGARDVINDTAELILNRYAYISNTGTVKVQHKMIGELLDIIA